MPDACASCFHSRPAHWHYPGAGLHPGGHGKCLSRGCPCERYVAPEGGTPWRDIECIRQEAAKVTPWPSEEANDAA